MEDIKRLILDCSYHKIYGIDYQYFVNVINRTSPKKIANETLTIEIKSKKENDNLNYYGCDIRDGIYELDIDMFIDKLVIQNTTNKIYNTPKALITTKILEYGQLNNSSSKYIMSVVDVDIIFEPTRLYIILYDEVMKFNKKISFINKNRIYVDNGTHKRIYFFNITDQLIQICYIEDENKEKINIVRDVNFYEFLRIDYCYKKSN